MAACALKPEDRVVQLINLFRRRTPVVLQGESDECGLSCLAMLLAAHGRHITLKELRAQTCHSKQLSVKEISSLLKTHNLLARCLRCEPKELNDIHLPALLHVDMNHYVVIEKVHSQGARLIDPGAGRVDVSWETLGRRFTGIALEVTPGPNFQPTGSLIRHSVWPLLKQLPLQELGPGLLSIVGLSVLIQAFVMTTPFYLQIVIDEVLMVSNLEMLAIVITGFLLVYLVSAATQMLRGLLVLIIGSRLSFMFAAGVMSHVQDIALPFFQKRTVGDIASRFASLQPIQKFLSESIVRIFVDTLMIITTLAVLFSVSGEIALYVLCGSATFLVMQYLLLLPYRRHQLEFLISDAGLQTQFIETIQAIDTTRRYQAEDQRLEDWQSRLADSLNASVSAQAWGLASEVSRYLLMGFISIAVVGVATQDIAEGTISLGMLYTLTAYASHLTSALVSLTAEWQSYLMLSLHVQRLSDITEAETDQRLPMPLSREQPVKSLELRNVTFRGNHATHDLFRVNIRINRSQALAVVGPSGSGKSTLLALLRGELAPASGEIRVNGFPVPSSQNQSGLISSSLPSDRLIRGSVMDNITYLDPLPNQRRLLKAAVMTGIHEHIMNLPLGYREPLSEENSLMSSGQRQRLLLARALYRRSDILLLDEATSHLDETSELKIMSRVIALPRICIFVTHNQKLARLADKVIQLNRTDTAEDPGTG